MLKSGQAWVVEFVTSTSTGAAANADSLPVGVLIVNGVDNAATVTVANVTTGRYKASVTLPALSAGDVVEMGITATIGGVAAAGVVARDTADTAYVSEVHSRIGAAGAGLTALGDTRLAYLDVAVSSRAAAVSGGSGGNTVTVTVTGGGSPLQDASVRLTKSGVSYVLATSALGVATFSLDAGTYALAVSLAGWAFTPTTVVVDGDETVAAAMTQVVIPAPTEPDACVVYAYARDIHGAAEASVPVVFRLEAVDGLEGSAFAGATHSVTSAADGLVQVQLPQGARASVFDRNSRWRMFDVPAAASYELQAVIV